jgi:hypothetical protein
MQEKILRDAERGQDIELLQHQRHAAALRFATMPRSE